MVSQCHVCSCIDASSPPSMRANLPTTGFDLVHQLVVLNGQREIPFSSSDRGVAEQHRTGGAVDVVRGHLVGVGGWAAVVASGLAAAAAAAAAAQPPGGRQDAVPCVLAHKAVERRVGQAVEGGEQQRQVVVVEDPWRKSQRDSRGTESLDVEGNDKSGSAAVE